MEIITYFNTDPEIRNLLQYGIEGKHYTIDTEGVLHRIENSGYTMDVNKTGNIFMAHPEEGLPADFWDVGVEHCENLQINPASGFAFDESTGGDIETFKSILALTDTYMARIEKCKTPEEIDAEVAKIKKELSENPNYAKLLDYREPTDGADGSLAYFYDSWLEENNYKIK